MLLKALDLLRTLGWALISFIFSLIDSIFEVLREMNGYNIIDSFFKVYSISSDKVLYTSFYNIDFINSKGNFSLEEAFNKGIVNLDDIKSNSTNSDELNDGGTVIYKFKKGKFSNKDFVLVDCKTIAGVNDVYIISSFDYDNSVCK